MNKNVPKLRFKEFNDEWIIGKFSDFMFESKEKNSIGEFEKKDVLSVSGEFGIINQIKHLGRSYAGASVKNYGVVRKDDIVYTKSPLKNNPYGIIKGNYGPDGIVSTLYAIYKCKKNTQSKFIHYYFDLDDNTNRYVRPLVHKGAKNDMKINNNYFLSGAISLPSLQEQEKVADFFTILDSLIEEQEGKVKDLETYKKGMMQKIFSQEIRFKDENGCDYPEWDESILGDVSDVRDGTHESPKYVDKGYPLITSKNLIEDGSIDYSNVNYITLDDYISINKRSEVKSGDILFGMIGTIGNPVLVDREGFAIKNVALIKEQGKLKNSYLLPYLNSSLIEKQFYKVNAGGTQKFIALNLIRSLVIKTPRLEEQEKIAKFSVAIDNIIMSEKKNLDDLREMKKGLLQQMFI